MIKSIATFRHVRVIRVFGLAAGAVAVAAGAVWMTASAAGLTVGFHSGATPSSQTSSATVANVDQQTGKASAVSQADAIKKKVAGQAPCALLPSAPKAPRSDLGAYKEALLGAAASALGITDQQLTADLAQGMTLSQIAAAQNPPVTEAQFRDRLIAKLTPLLDAAVTKKQLTQAQEQAIIQQLKTGPIPFWSKPMPAPKKPVAASPAAT
ncbi:MAG: hypothetical protein E6I23_08440 [Chloroflexi bacterium]|nr:MAG: hypothetical protein E6I23_08440 [Chloroflexota bacterium]